MKSVQIVGHLEFKIESKLSTLQHQKLYSLIQPWPDRHQGPSWPQTTCFITSGSRKSSQQKKITQAWMILTVKFDGVFMHVSFVLLVKNQMYVLSLAI